MMNNGMVFFELDSHVQDGSASVVSKDTTAPKGERVAIASVFLCMTFDSQLLLHVVICHAYQMYYCSCTVTHSVYFVKEAIGVLLGHTCWVSKQLHASEKPTLVLSRLLFKLINM